MKKLARCVIRNCRLPYSKN